jgi:O-antigen/teichoic acid export membrane protein
LTSIRLALLLSLGQSYASLVINLASNMAVARILTPTEIGVFSVSFAVIGIAQVLRDFGVGNYLIQQKAIEKVHVQTAFGVALLIGLVLFALVFALAPAAASYYNEPQMAATIRISSLNFLIVPFSTVSVSLLLRDLQFKRLVPVTLIGLAAGNLVTVLCALAGLGADSMAIGSVAANIVTTVGTAVARGRDSLVAPSLRGWRSVVRFGSQTSLIAVVTTVSMNSNDLLVSRMLGFYSVAILSRAQGIMSLVSRDLIAAVRNVALPGFAAVHRSGEALADIYLRSVAIVTALSWTLYGLLGMFPLEALRLLFGRQWDDAVPLVPVYCLSGALLTTTALYSSVLTALGRIDLVMRAELLLQPLRLALIAAAAYLFRTLEACALAHLVSSAFALAILCHFRSKALPTDSAARFKYLASSLSVAVAALTPALALALYYGFDRTEPIHIAALAAVGLLTATTGTFAAGAFRHPIADEPLYLKLRQRLAALRLPGRRRGVEPRD